MRIQLFYQLLIQTPEAHRIHHKDMSLRAVCFHRLEGLDKLPLLLLRGW